MVKRETTFVTTDVYFAQHFREMCVFVGFSGVIYIAASYMFQVLPTYDETFVRTDVLHMIAAVNSINNTETGNHDAVSSNIIRRKK